MKQLFFYFALLIIMVSSCNESQNNSSSDKQNEVNGKDSNMVEENQPTKKNEVSEFVLNKIPTLMAIAKEKDTNLYYDLSDYVELLFSEITNLENTEKVLEKRDSLKENLSKLLTKNKKSIDDNWDKIQTELNQIGYKPFYAEGMVLKLETIDILREEINKYATEDFKLYEGIKNKISKTAGDMYLNNYFEVVAACENLRDKYPNSKYLKKVNKDFQRCLNIVTNIHFANGDRKTCLLGEFDTDTYPFWTVDDFENKIIRAYPKSKYALIIKKVLQNISNLQKGEKATEIYAVVIDKFRDKNEAENKNFEYLNDGKDIVHVVATDGGNYYTCYRYYDNKEAAKKALEMIKQDFKAAYIIKFSLIEGEFGYNANSKTLKKI